MNIVCRICRTWILRQRIQAQQAQLERVVFAWSHDAILARRLVQAATETVVRDLDLFREGERLRIALYRTLLASFRQYQRDYREVLSFAPEEKMSAARKPMVRKVRQAFAQLDEIPRLIVSLADLGGCSYKEIECVLDISRAELLEHLCNARVQLKSMLFSPMARPQTISGQMLWSIK